MANTDNPTGFTPIGHLLNGDNYGVPRKYRINSSTGTVLYKGDVVKWETTGNVEISAADDGAAVLGVFDGCEYLNADRELVRSPVMPADKTGLTNMFGYVYDDPFIIYAVQLDTGTTPTEAGSVLKTANHVAGSGDSNTKLSGHELDASDIGTGSQFTILGLVETPDNSWGEHAKVRGIFNEHALKATSTGGI